MATTTHANGLLRGVLQTLAIVAAFVGVGLAGALAAQGAGGPYPGGVGPDGVGPEADGVESEGMGSGRSDIEIWLVDGFNLLHTGLLGGRDRSGWWREDQRRRVVERVATLRDPSTELAVVFDGRKPALEADSRGSGPSPEPDCTASGPGSWAEPPAEANPRVRVVFAPSADDWLLHRVRSAPDPDRVAVVTADRKLADRSRHHGARVVTPRAFLARCARDEPA